VKSQQYVLIDLKQQTKHEYLVPLSDNAFCDLNYDNGVNAVTAKPSNHFAMASSIMKSIKIL